VRCVLLIVAVAALAVAAIASATERRARADAAIVRLDDQSFGTASSHRDGDRDEIRTGLTEDGVTVGDGEAITRTQAGGIGYATVKALEVDVLSGRVTASGVRRTSERTTNGLVHRGGVYALRIEGRYIGDVQRRRTIPFSAGEVIVNAGNTGLRVKTADADIRVAVATVATRIVATPTPTATPTPAPTTAPTTAPTATATAVKRKRAPSVKRRLTRGGYAFPVYSRQARVADNFGAARAAPITVHQGDDIFAPFGSPVVAVRDGRIDHVGTLPIAGNRLWLHTANGDSFFYAHLSAFSDAARDGAHVKAGAVLGFVGNTGDAEPTPPHLHFEVHPGGMNRPAVDPYPIVTAWQHRTDVPPGAWLQQLGPDATEHPGALVTVRDFIAE
jgi:murein DD-endopeptidase MepM/ murein hydrolase activator NlpD